MEAAVLRVVSFIGMSSTPNIEKDNWYRFGDPDSEGEEIEFDPDVDEVADTDIFDDKDLY